jgi:hypothetical protein
MMSHWGEGGKVRDDESLRDPHHESTLLILSRKMTARRASGLNICIPVFRRPLLKYNHFHTTHTNTITVKTVESRTLKATIVNSGLAGR